MTCAVPQLIFEDAVKKIPEPDMYLQLYNVANKFSFAKDLQDTIFKYV